MLHVKWKQLHKRTQPAWSLWRQKPIKILTRKSCCYFCRHLESASKNIPKQYLFIFLPFHFLPQDPLLTRLLNVYYSLASLRRVVGERKLCSFEQSLQKNCSQAKLQRGEADSVRLGGARTQKDAQGHCTLSYSACKLCSPDAAFQDLFSHWPKRRGQTFLIGRWKRRRSVSFLLVLGVTQVALGDQFL